MSFVKNPEHVQVLAGSTGKCRENVTSIFSTFWLHVYKKCTMCSMHNQLFIKIRSSVTIPQLWTETKGLEKEDILKILVQQLWMRIERTSLHSAQQQRETWRSRSRSVPDPPRMKAKLTFLVSSIEVCSDMQQLWLLNASDKNGSTIWEGGGASFSEVGLEIEQQCFQVSDKNWYGKWILGDFWRCSPGSSTERLK